MSAPREGDALERLEKWLRAKDVRWVTDIFHNPNGYSVRLDAHSLPGSVKGRADVLALAIHAALDAAGAEPNDESRTAPTGR